jgi:hypothetical protein
MLKIDRYEKSMDIIKFCLYVYLWRTFYYYYYLFTVIGFAPGGNGPYTTQLQQKTYNKNKFIP